MKKLLILTALCLYLAAHAVVGVATLCPQPAMADCGGGSC
jgi:hypothetical protein